MERKIGEIRQVNGEWYQCVVAIQGCRECSFRTQDYCTSHSECMSQLRSDGRSVIFKKLEKVGESYSKYVFPRGNVLVQRYKLHIPCDTNVSNGYWIYHWNEKLVDIEIKQIKEDMEEKKENLKPFDLQKAREGKPVCTRDGRKARIICFDLKNDEYPIVVAITNNGEENEIYKYSIDGKICTISTIKEDDLMMLPEKKEGWVNIYALNPCYSSKEEAEANIDRDYEHEYVRTVKVEWEE